jgi:hypothetical protein
MQALPRTTPIRLNPLTIGLYLNAALLAVILGSMLMRSNVPPILPAAFAQTQPPMQPPIAGGAGIFVVPAQFSTNLWGCYLMDVDSQTLCAYQYVSGEHQLRLVAARNFTYDRRLKNYNTANPSPSEVKDLVEKEQAGTRGKTP